MGVDDGEAELIVAFHVAVTDAADTAKLGSGHLHPNQVVGVVDNSHLVGFGVADAEADLGLFRKLHDPFYPASRG